MVQLPNARLSDGLRKFIHARISDPPYASEEEAALAVSKLLAADACAAPEDRDAVYQQLADMLSEIRSSLSLAEKAPELGRDVEAILAAIAAIDRERRTEVVQAQENIVLEKTEALIDAMAAQPGLDRAARSSAAMRIAQWDFDRVNDFARMKDEPEAVQDTSITRESLTAYLQDRFEDPDLRVESFSTSASGGYGKQTYFFESTGKLSGSFVLRRDRNPAMLSNDCHLVASEYPVVQAVNEAGFAAPETVWADLEHPLLPGGNFFVMRRAPGKVTGTVFGGTEALPKARVAAFAEAVGRFHSIGPLVGLGDLNDSIRAELWSLPLHDVVRQYITGYRDYYLSHRDSKVPALTAAFSWLLENVPESDDRPVLVHGDLGLHNILFEGEELSMLLDWEQAHVGDPLEDLGYIRNTANESLDWPLFVERYEATSGIKVDPRRVHYQQVWSHVKNAVGSIIANDLFTLGALDDFKLAQLNYFYHPIFLGEAMRLIEQA